MAAMRRQDGQTAAEYLGVLVLVAVVIGVLTTSDAGARIRDGIKTKICEIAQQTTCATAAEQEAEAKRPACINASRTQRIDAKAWVSARILKGGLMGGREYRIVERPDGTYQVSLTVDGGAFVGPGLGRKGMVDGDGRAKGAFTETLAPVRSKAEAEALVRRFIEADQKTSQRLAMLGWCPVCAGISLATLPNFYDFPRPETESYTGAETSGAEITVNGSRGPAEGKLKVSTEGTVGMTNVTSGPEKGSTTLFYERDTSGAASGGINEVLNYGLSLEGKGKTRAALKLGPDGLPTKLTLTSTVQGGVGGPTGLQLKGTRSYGEAMKKLKPLDLKGEATTGKGVELTTEVDLTDPVLRRQAMIVMTGIDPETGEPADTTAAAQALAQAAADSTTFGARTFDYDKRKASGGVDIVVAGAEGSYEDTTQTTTGYWLYDPQTGAMTYSPRCPGSSSGPAVSQPPN